jgi:hypothetical protein
MEQKQEENKDTPPEVQVEDDNSTEDIVDAG